jgi:cytochrome c peroxidase
MERKPSHLAIFRAVPSAAQPGLTDLGLWNIFANSAFPSPQQAIRTLFGVSSAPTDEDLARMVALFKTPTVRDLGQTGPYFHTGRMDGLDSVLRHYVRFSELARMNRVRNGDVTLQEIAITPANLDGLQAFLRSLNEDYND